MDNGERLAKAAEELAAAARRIGVSNNSLHATQADNGESHEELQRGLLIDSLRPKAAAKYLGISRSALYKWVAERPDFPRPRHLSARVTVFSAQELRAYRDRLGSVV